MANGATGVPPAGAKRLHQPLIEHRVGHLQEAADVGAVHQISGRAVLLGRPVAVFVDGDHDLVQTIVNFVAPYPSRNWFVTRRPYSWSLFPDGTNVVEASVSWITSRLNTQKTAEYAGPAYKGKPRKYAVVAPDKK